MPPSRSTCSPLGTTQVTSAETTNIKNDDIRIGKLYLGTFLEKQNCQLIVNDIGKCIPKAPHATKTVKGKNEDKVKTEF